MKLNCLLTSLLFCSVFSLTALGTPHSELIRRRAIADLDAIHSMFEIKYAPKEWKKEFANWDLNTSIQQAKNRIENLAQPTVKECQIALRDFFNSAKDYHVGIRFFSTEGATLPFLVKGASQRYFVCYVNSNQVDTSLFPFEEGDEILTFSGEPIHDVIVKLREQEFGHNTLETDHALAEIALTQRKGSMGHLIPTGEVEIVGLKRGSCQPIAVTMTWHHCPEKVSDFSKLGATLDLHAMSYFDREKEDSLNDPFKCSALFNKSMVYHMWDRSYVGPFNTANPHDVGARSSFIPSLGRKIWRSPADSSFDAYMFDTPSGKRIGYIRLPDYEGGEEQVMEFGLIMNLFQRKTDALVIDQINNPGGSVFYLYALTAIFTNTPLYAPKHQIALTQEEVYTACTSLSQLEQVKNDEIARRILGETIGGYPIDYQFVEAMRDFCHFMIKQWNSGKIFSDPTHLFGVNEIKPHPRYRYTKPILLLVNALDFSGADFFPAILQDNNRATVMGVRTAGAGGYVSTTSYPNHTGIQSFIMTGSIAERKNAVRIENLGVTPDIKCELTVTDLQEKYCEYAAAIVREVEALIKK